MTGTNSTVGIEAARFARVLYIARNMRGADANEIFNLMRVSDPVQLAGWAMGATLHWVATKDQEPVCAFGATELWPHVWSVHLFATPRFSEVALTVMRQCCGPMQEAVRAMGCHRLQCYSAESHKGAHSFLERCGAVFEAPVRRFGKTGEDYRLYAWTDEDVRPLGKEVRDVHGR